MDKALELKKMLANLDSDRLTKEDFVSAWEQIVELILKIKAENKQTVDSLEAAFSTLQKTISKLSETERSGIQSNFSKLSLSLTSSVDAKLSQVDTRLAQIRDGKDADEERVAARAAALAVSQIKVPSLDELKSDLPRMGAQSRDGLELLTGDERLDKSAIKGLDGLDSKLAELESIRVGAKNINVGGLINTVRVHDLSGELNGSTKVFVVPRHRRAVLLVGTQFPVIYRPTVDYTTANVTLTLTDQVAAPETGQSLIFQYIK